MKKQVDRAAKRRNKRQPFSVHIHWWVSLCVSVSVMNGASVVLCNQTQIRRWHPSIKASTRGFWRVTLAQSLSFKRRGFATPRLEWLDHCPFNVLTDLEARLLGKVGHCETASERLKNKWILLHQSEHMAEASWCLHSLHLHKRGVNTKNHPAHPSLKKLVVLLIIVLHMLVFLNLLDQTWVTRWF